VPIVIDDAERLEIGRQVKRELRDRMKRVRRALGDENRAARSVLIEQKLTAMPEWQRAHTVALFVPMRTEIDVTLLERSARAAGKRVVAPRMLQEDDGSMELELREWEHGVEPVESGKLVREPPADAPLVDPASVDLVVVPGLVFDERGARIGYGAGLYDRLLPKCMRASWVGVAHDFQLLSEIPEGPGDQRVDAIVTNDRVLWTDSRPRR
jgi:5-formyltetrahydrofolate cyclo-ligase